MSPGLGPGNRRFKSCHSDYQDVIQKEAHISIIANVGETTMAKEAIYEVNQPIKFKYRCNGDPATANPVVEILDETGVVDPIFVVVLTQIGASRLFKGEFTPDAVGVWSVHVTDSNGGDQVKDFAVGSIGVQTMAEAIVTIDGKCDTLSSKVDDIAADSGGAHFA